MKRIPQDSDYAVLQQEIDSLRREAVDLAQSHATTTDSLRLELAKEGRWFSDAKVADHRRTLARIEARQQLIIDRIPALQRRLPTNDERGVAEAEARTLLEHVMQTKARFTDASSRFLAALEAAEATGRSRLATDNETRQMTAALANVVATYGLEIDVPEPPAPQPQEARLASALATWAQLAAVSLSTDATIENELRAARERRAEALATCVGS